MSFIKEYSKYIISNFSEPFPIIITEANNEYVTDIDGKKYLDFWAGIATVNAGHNNPKVQDAVKKQLEKLVHCASQSYYTLPPLELAKKLTSVAPFQECKTTFFTSGSEANDVALKMVRRYSRKHEVLAFQGSYHGQTYGSRSLGTPVSSYSKSSVMGPWLPGIVHVPAPYCYRCSLGLNRSNCNLQCVSMVEDIIHFATSRDVAAFIAEPILGVGGIVTPPDSYFQELEKVLDRHGILLILDEVQTGFGRTGRMWGAETYSVKPSMITLAKALGNGWPISALIASTPLCDALESGDHFSTWGSNPVMCSAALATLDYVVENRLWENAAKVGREMFDRLKEIEGDNSVVGEVRGKGLMLGIEIVKTKRSREPAVEACQKIRKMCAESGLIVGVGGFWSNVIRVQPPLTINEKQVEEGVEILERVLKHVEGLVR